jgi:hypothetical protein
MPEWETRTGIARLAARISAMGAELRRLRGGLRVPFVETDPDASAGNMWAFPDGRVRIRMPDGTVVQLATSPDTGGTSTVPMPTPEQQEATYQTTWEATWTRSYQQSGVARSDTNLYWGKADAVNGVQASLIGLPYTAILAALTGATITKVEVLLHVAHTGYESGTTVFLHGHSNTAAPATLGGVGSEALASMAVAGVDVGELQGWHVVSRGLGQELADGTTRGFSLIAPSSSLEHYGEAAGVGSGLQVPAIRITYYK